MLLAGVSPRNSAFHCLVSLESYSLQNEGISLNPYIHLSITLDSMDIGYPMNYSK